MEKLTWNKKFINYFSSYFSAFCLFAIIYIFFTNVHPIIPYDGDDWLSFSQFRHAVPMAGYWNAGRVFQEILYPFLGMFSAFIVYPVTGDYMFSHAITIALVLAFAMSVLYVVLFRLFFMLAKKRYAAFFGCLYMVVFFFGFFKTRYESTYMLHGLNYTCVVSYIIPGLLCSILVCILLGYQARNIPVVPQKTGVFKFGFLILFSYLAVFSMLYVSVILAGYCVLFMIVSAIKTKRFDHKNNLFHICVVAGFLIYCCFEITSSRASADTINTFALNESTGFFQRIIIAIGTSFVLFRQISPVFVVFSVITAAAALVIFFMAFDKNKKSVFVIPVLMTLALTAGVYFSLIIVSAVAGAAFYPQFIQALYGVFFYLFLSIMFFLVYVLKNFRKSLLFMPVIIFIFINELFNANYRFSDQMSYYWAEGQLSTSKKIELTNNWIYMMKEAERAGEQEVTLFVPDYPNTDDFPHPKGYWGTGFSGALFVHKITGRYIKINLEYVDGILPRNSYWQYTPDNP